MWERQEERRAEKLADIREQVENGTLRIRQMTAKERAENPPRPPRPGSRGAKGRPRKAQTG
jgi:tripartite-type tricarboxylate transporter receptor subunit TctC